MSSDESDTVRELYESFQELSQEEVREFFENIQSEQGFEGGSRLNPPWGKPILCWPQPWPPKDDPIIRPLPWPPIDDDPRNPIDLQSTRQSALGLQSAPQSTTTITMSSRPDLREEDSEEDPWDLDISYTGPDDHDQFATASAGWADWVATGGEFLGKVLAGDAEGLGLTGTINVDNCHRCTIHNTIIIQN